MLTQTLFSTLPRKIWSGVRLPNAVGQEGLWSVSWLAVCSGYFDSASSCWLLKQHHLCGQAFPYVSEKEPVNGFKPQCAGMERKMRLMVVCVSEIRLLPVSLCKALLPFAPFEIQFPTNISLTFPPWASHCHSSLKHNWTAYSTTHFAHTLLSPITLAKETFTQNIVPALFALRKLHEPLTRLPYHFL